MKKYMALSLLLMLALAYSGCQKGNTDGEADHTPAAGVSVAPSVLPEAPDGIAAAAPPASQSGQPSKNESFSHEITQDGVTATVSLGMTYDAVTSLLDQAGIVYSAGNQWADAGPGEAQSGISLTKSQTKEYLDFSKSDNILAHIQWTTAEGDETAFPGCIAAAIEAYGFLPAYHHAQSGNDTFVFPLDGGYYMQFHDYGPGDAGDGQVIASLTYDDPYGGAVPFSDYAYLLSEDVSCIPENAVDLENVLADVRKTYGDTDNDGNENSYSCQGIALYDRQLYYSIRWASIVQDQEGGGRSSYNGQLYVSLDGSRTLRGYHNEVSAG